MSRKFNISQLPAKKRNQLFFMNIGQSLISIYLCAKFEWQRGIVEEKMTNKYLWMFDNKDLKEFDQNQQDFVQLI
jgi:hypothetical protein